MDSLFRVRDLMSSEVATLKLNDKLSIADDVMSLGRIRHAPVLDDEGETVVGIVSQRDLFRGALATALGYGQHGQSKILDMLLVKEVMTTEPATIRETDLVADAARIMVESKIGCLPVLDDRDKLVGIITESDFVRLVLTDE